MDINRLFGTTSREEKAAKDMAAGLEDGYVLGNKLLKLIAEETMNKPPEFRAGFIAGLRDAL